MNKEGKYLKMIYVVRILKVVVLFLSAEYWESSLVVEIYVLSSESTVIPRLQYYELESFRLVLVH